LGKVKKEKSTTKLVKTPESRKNDRGRRGKTRGIGNGRGY